MTTPADPASTEQALCWLSDRLRERAGVWLGGVAGAFGLAILVLVIVMLALIWGIGHITSTVASHESPEYEIREP